MKTSTELTKPAVMKTIVLSVIIFCTTLLTSVRAFAQSVPDKVEVDIDAGGDAVWYGQPWVWAVGVAIFIVIIVAITRNNKNA